jgi:NADH-quinone oxidoreductase subunit L
MFLGVGAASTAGGIFHLFTHAFFKALLFLTAGSVMHALAGQLDLRKMSGLRRKMPITAGLMFVGCLALAGFPFMSGFYSKDMILAEVFTEGIAGAKDGRPLYLVLGFMGLATAFLTAFYTFRLWFRVFMGPEKYEMGQEHHGAEEGHAPVDHAAAAGHAEAVPHEVGWLMNGPLLVLAAGALVAGWWAEEWLVGAVNASTAAADRSEIWLDVYHRTVHPRLPWIASALALSGIGLAAYYHWLRRDAADRVAARYPTVVRILANKYYVDEFYDRAIVRPLHLAGEIFFVIDSLVIDGFVAGVGFLPRLLGMGAAAPQRGKLQGYGLGMLAGAAVVLFVIVRYMR